MKNKKIGLKKTALVSALLLEMTTASQAATITVDNSTCLLPDAITAANTDTATNGCSAGSGSDEVVLPENSLIELNNALSTISNELTVSCNNSTISRAKGASDFPIVDTDFGANLTLNDCVITSGRSSSETSNNGGGIKSFYGDLTINRSQIIGNQGGGIYSYNSNVNINYSTIANNFGNSGSNRFAAGVTFTGGNIEINDSTISNNATYGGAKGGGVYVRNSYFYQARLEVTNSTISGNSSESGAGGVHQNSIYYYLNQTDSRVTLSMVTMVNNSTSGNGGGIFNNDGRITVGQSLISGNFGGLGNEIVSTDIYGMVLGNYNLLGLNGDDGTFGVIIDNQSSDAIIQETNLSDVIETELKDNGGFNLTHKLQPDSPGIDFIPEASCANSFDQTGTMRPIDGDGDGAADCDVGAVEYTDLIFRNGFD